MWSAPCTSGFTRDRTLDHAASVLNEELDAIHNEGFNLGTGLVCVTGADADKAEFICGEVECGGNVTVHGEVVQDEVLFRSGDECAFGDL